MGCKQKGWASSVAEVIKSRGAFSTLSSFHLPAGCIGFSGNARTLGMMQPLNGRSQVSLKAVSQLTADSEVVTEVACPENIFTPYLSPDSVLLTPWLCSHSTHSGCPSGSPQPELNLCSLIFPLISFLFYYS